MFIEKVVGAHMILKFPALLRKPKAHHRVHKKLPMDTVLKQTNSVHSLPLTLQHYSHIFPYISQLIFAFSFSVTTLLYFLRLLPVNYKPPISFFLI
jgi:hypothetical protein